MPILNYTTKIDSAKTLGEIQGILSKRGVRKMIIDYDEHGNASALTFQININNIPVGFSLPCNWEGVQRALAKDGKRVDKAQALRVSWRIIKTWVEAQMAIVDAQLVKIEEVFLPYAITKSGETLYKRIASGSSNLLLTK